jgi:hypothetical protein
MPGVLDPHYVAARSVLLDALEALGEQRQAVILVGAQAIYLHTGAIELAVPELTIDADLTIDPALLQALGRTLIVILGCAFGLSLLPQSRACRSLAFEVINRVLERNAVLLQESIEFVTGWNLQQHAELMRGDPVGPVRIDGQRLERRSRRIPSFLGELADGVVREVQPNLHRFSIGEVRFIRLAITARARDVTRTRLPETFP